MRFSTIFGYITLLITSINALPAAFEDDFQALDDQWSAGIEKRQNTIFPVTGTGSQQRPRLEVRTLQKKKNQWNLFLIALRRFHDLPQSEKLSYYQISGIHGVPRQDWDGVGQCSACGNADGYCPHDSILFLGWHRAYIALFEQRFVQIAKQVAQEYPAGNKRKQMVGAANLLRWPYWDWAAHAPNGGNNMPSFFTTANIQVDSPSGKKTIKNPMFRHDFTDPSQMRYSPFVNWKVTLRYPQSNANSASSQTNQAVAALNNIRQNMQDQVYQMFSTCDEFVEVGSDQAGSSSSRCSNSMEGIHNTIHNAVGGTGSSGVSGGHMTYLATSSFDPVFWLHHCNVDRMFALWQGIYPNSYSGSQNAPGNTWTVAQGSNQNLNSPLTPFHRNSNGDFWTTNLVRDWWKFGYTYPEYQNSDGSKGAIQSIVNKLYGPSATATAGTSKRTAMPEPIPQESEAGTATSVTSAASATSSTSAASSAAPTGYGLGDAIDDTVGAIGDTIESITPLKANNGSFYQYTANVQTPRYQLGGSYWIYFFNGAPSHDDPTQYLLASNLIGPVGVLAQEGMVMDKEVIAAYSVPLTRSLTADVASGAIADLEEDTVVPYLEKNLEWRIVNSDGQIVDPDSVDGFEVVVYSSTATPPKEYELPIWSEFVPLADITEYKAGGATALSLGIETVDSVLNSTLGAIGL